MSTTPSSPYTADLFSYHRRPTRVVMVGDVAVGGDNPIRVQSMTTTLTKDVEATVSQAERLVMAGCEIVRITTPTPSDARCLEPIRRELQKRGISVPLVADIHFSPQAAMVAADYADKVRVNPGNYVDSRKFAVREYTDLEYEEEVLRTAERFTPLVLKCKERGIAMRIGTNHGSLSDRIMNRFGDTPEGMVESALEFVRVCEQHDYHDIILSMKASNPKIMIAAYRLLAARMTDLDMHYPFHLGVTEAGNAEDGRIKSAVGIGSLLEDGIGDTIRVSLTEEPEAEIPVAIAIASRYADPTRPKQANGSDTSSRPAWDPFHYARRQTEAVDIGGLSIGGSQTMAVFAPLEDGLADNVQALPRILRWASPAGRRQPKPDAAHLELRSEGDVRMLERMSSKLREFPGARLALVAASHDVNLLSAAAPLADGLYIRSWGSDTQETPIVELAARALDLGKGIILCGSCAASRSLDDVVEELIHGASILEAQGVSHALTLEAPEEAVIDAYRLLAARAAEVSIKSPILLQIDCDGRQGLESLLPASISIGSLLCDGIGDAVLLKGAGDSIKLAFDILQATGARITKTDYVACPSCGRTLFDLQETTDRIKSRTSHLVGVKLAIMGCIVNGPGEMADADFGYVGGAPGKVNLYVGKECVEKGVPTETADERLIELIKSRGKWQEEVQDDLAPEVLAAT